MRDFSTRSLHQRTADERIAHVPDHKDLVERDGGDGGTELWLDLRGTSLTPRSALELWHVQERQINDHKQQAENDAKAPFVKCLVSSNENARKAAPPRSNNKDEQTPGVLFVAENDGEEMEPIFLQQTASTADKPIFGRVLSVQSSSSTPILPDPFPAMEVLSEGQWVVLDTNGWEKASEEDRMAMALPLLELLSGSALSSGGDGTSGESTGGIGLTCHTKKEVVQAAMFVRSIANVVGGGMGGRRRNARTKTLDSGIVIPDDDDDEEAGVTLASGSNALQRNDGANNFAIIVPYDFELLQAAQLLCGDSSENGNEI